MSAPGAGGADEPLDATDARLLDAIAAMHTERDPVPDGLVDRLIFGVALDALHAEVAELQRLDTLAGTRAGSASESQTVTFTSSTLTTMVTIAVVSADEVRIDGWITPGAGVAVELRAPDQSLHTTADENGRFAFPAAPRGLARFVLRVPGDDAARPVVTPALEI